MNFLVKLFFILIFFFCPNAVYATSEQWSVVNANEVVDWQVTENQIIAQMWQPVGQSFLISNSEYFPVMVDFIWQVEVRPEQGLDHNLVWGFVDDDNYYQLHLAGESIWVNRFIGGQEMLARGINFSWKLGETYLLKIKRTNGLLSIWLDNYEIFHFYDWTYSEASSLGGWGFKLAAGAVFPVKTVFKNSIFLETDLLVLPIKKFLQIDEIWATEVYDQATNWSERPTIGRWGCSLTSMVMILNYHGFEFFSDGSELNPETLNQWLKQQPDGYIYPGLVNWWAITRLVSQLSDENQALNLPKLEFSVVKENIFTSLELLIRSKLPVIAQVPNHFVVVNGLVEGKDDFLVTDPLAITDQLSEYEKTLSLRVFQPSFTDLSYLVVAHSPNTAVSIKDVNGAIVDSTVITEQLATEFEPVVLTTLAKPIEQAYYFEFSNFDQNLLPIIYVYSSTATLTKFTLEKNNLVQQKIILNFKKNNISTLNYLYSWEDFLQLVEKFFQQHKITLVAKNRLVERVNLIKQADTDKNKQRHQQYLLNLINFYQHFNNDKVINELKKIATFLVAQPA
ncbi:MAG: C39 family peptidase [Candidatus Pacebacteria bacterium]|nr:C39 family peptidase [Candidatus Paceibacterota bacterium]